MRCKVLHFERLFLAFSSTLDIFASSCGCQASPLRVSISSYLFLFSLYSFPFFSSSLSSFSFLLSRSFSSFLSFLFFFFLSLSSVLWFLPLWVGLLVAWLLRFFGLIPGRCLLVLLHLQCSLRWEVSCFCILVLGLFLHLSFGLLCCGSFFIAYNISTVIVLVTCV